MKGIVMSAQALLRKYKKSMRKYMTYSQSEHSTLYFSSIVLKVWENNLIFLKNCTA